MYFHPEFNMEFKLKHFKTYHKYFSVEYVIQGNSLYNIYSIAPVQQIEPTKINPHKKTSYYSNNYHHKSFITVMNNHRIQLC